MRNCGKVAVIGIGSWIGGILTQRLINNNNNTNTTSTTTTSSTNWYCQLKQSYLTIVNHFNQQLIVGATKAFGPSEPNTTNTTGGVVPIETTDSLWLSKDTRQQRMNQIMKYGFPTFENVRGFNDFVLSYDKRNRVPHWVFEHLTKQNVKFNPSVDRSRCEFYPDKLLHPYFRSTNEDYKGSGYDRGHLAAAGNHKSTQSSCEETFILSNMSPQIGKGFNRDAWNNLEKHVRTLVKLYDNVYVCTGPLYLPRRESNGRNYVRYEVIGPNHVAVPTHFFKVVLAEMTNGQLIMEAYVMPNAPIPDNISIQTFQVPIETIERAAGFLLFEKASRNAFGKINGRPPLL